MILKNNKVTVNDLLVERISVSIYGAIEFAYPNAQVLDDAIILEDGTNLPYHEIFNPIFAEIHNEVEKDCVKFAINIDYQFHSFSEKDTYGVRQRKINTEVPNLAKIEFSGDYYFNNKAIELLKESLVKNG